MVDIKTRTISLMACLWAAGWVWGGGADLADDTAQLYAWATNQFAAAIFFKPLQATNAEIAFQLAPLIIQEVRDQQVSAAWLSQPSGVPAMARDVPASLFVLRHASWPAASGLLSNAPASAPQSVVFYAADSLQFAGRAHARFSYQWFYGGPEPPGKQPSMAGQGIRITLDSRGQPAIWEVLRDTSGLRLIFASQSLEAASAAEFGKPLPGRRYAIERGLDQAPAVVVPRVIDDGPIPMGPIVYLREGTRNVSTVICRCMPAQVKQLVATRTFELAPLDSTASNAILATAGMAPNAPPVLWPTDERAENRLDHWLRLPAGF